MSYPDFTPAARSYEPSSWPVKTFQTMNGSEVRLLYGDTPTNAKLKLTYANVSDSNVQQFLDHYQQTKGTFLAFPLSAGATRGWQGGAMPGVTTKQDRWRYEAAPSVSSVRPGVSTVDVTLLEVL